MKRLTIDMTLHVVFQKEDGSDLTQDEVNQLYSNIGRIPGRAAGEGMFSAGLPHVTVESWSSGTYPGLRHESHAASRLGDEVEIPDELT